MNELSWYNANTDKSVVQNRADAISSVWGILRDTGKAPQKIIRYSGGYYYGYFFCCGSAEAWCIEIASGGAMNIWHTSDATAESAVFTLTKSYT